MMNDDELRERFRALARSESEGAPLFYSEEMAVRRSLERRKHARDQRHALFSSKRFAAATASAMALAMVLVFVLTRSQNPMKRAIVSTCKAVVSAFAGAP